ELLIAVVLSAQTTDVSVNKVTPNLFSKYPDIVSLANADLVDVKSLINSIGLYNTKAKNIILLCEKIISDYNGEVPDDINQLMSLPSVGRKTANVVLSEYFNIPAIAVDTHVERVSKRLGLANKKDDVLMVEKKLQKKIAKEQWHFTHHLLIYFGRYFCKSKNPLCDQCPFVDFCKESKKIKYRNVKKAS
ncbi:MAG: endonuclease III, partial [Erysipelotrichaceae bacterium]